MCYKGIIALKDAYCDPSSLQSGVEFSLLISKGELVWEVLTSIGHEDEITRCFLKNFLWIIGSVIFSKTNTFYGGWLIFLYDVGNGMHFCSKH